MLKKNLTLHYSPIIVFIHIIIFLLLTEAILPDQSQTKVLVGIYVTHIGNIDIKNQTFYAEFYLNMKWAGERTAEDFEFTNAKEFSKYFYSKWTDGGFNYLSCKIRGVFRSNMDVSSFPFDSQLLTIKLGDYVWIEDSLKYAKNDTLSGISNELHSAEWEFLNHSINVKPLKELGSKFSTIEFNVQASRNYTSFIIKILIPVIIVVLVSLLTLFIPKKELEACIGLGITSLLSLIALHFSIGGQLPEVNYPTTIDLLMIGSYFLVFINMVEVVLAYNLLQRKKEKKAFQLENISRWLIPSVYFLYLLILFGAFSIFDLSFQYSLFP